jgi:hypothetical protein
LSSLREVFKHGAKRGGAQVAALTQLVEGQGMLDLLQGLEHPLLRAERRS